MLLSQRSPNTKYQESASAPCTWAAKSSSLLQCLSSRMLRDQNDDAKPICTYDQTLLAEKDAAIDKLKRQLASRNDAIESLEEAIEQQIRTMQHLQREIDGLVDVENPSTPNESSDVPLKSQNSMVCEGDNNVHVGRRDRLIVGWSRRSTAGRLWSSISSLRASQNLRTVIEDPTIASDLSTDSVSTYSSAHFENETTSNFLFSSIRNLTHGLKGEEQEQHNITSFRDIFAKKDKLKEELEGKVISRDGTIKSLEDIIKQQLHTIQSKQGELRVLTCKVHGGRRSHSACTA